VVKSPDDATILVYIPEKTDVELYNPQGYEYSAQWFNPVTNEYFDAEINQYSFDKIEKSDEETGVQTILTIQKVSKKITFTHNFENDMLIILKKK